MHERRKNNNNNDDEGATRRTQDTIYFAGSPNPDQNEVVRRASVLKSYTVIRDITVTRF